MPQGTAPADDAHSLTPVAGACIDARASAGGGGTTKLPLATQRILQTQNRKRPGRMPRYLTIQEVAQQARCEHRTVRRAIRSGDLNASLIGGRWIVREDAVEAWFDARTNTASSRPAAWIYPLGGIRPRDPRPEMDRHGPAASPTSRRSARESSNREHPKAPQLLRRPLAGGRPAAVPLVHAPRRRRRVRDRRQAPPTARRARARSDPVTDDARRVRPRGVVAAICRAQPEAVDPASIPRSVGHAPVAGTR